MDEEKQESVLQKENREVTQKTRDFKIPLYCHKLLNLQLNKIRGEQTFSQQFTSIYIHHKTSSYSNKNIRLYFQQQMQQTKDDIKNLVSKFIVSKKIKSSWIKKFENQCSSSSSCNCGKSKHYTKITPIKHSMNLLTTIYQNQFQKRTLNNLDEKKIKIPHEKYDYERINKTSEYNDRFQEKNQYEERVREIRKRNSLEVGGPFFDCTTYGKTFEVKSKSPPVEPVKKPDHLVTLGLRMKTESTYNKFYQWGKLKNKRLGPFKRKDKVQIMNSVDKIGKSTYKRNFSSTRQIFSEEKPNKPAKKYRSIPGIKMKSSYQREFGQKDFDKCPAH